MRVRSDFLFFNYYYCYFLWCGVWIRNVQLGEIYSEMNYLTGEIADKYSKRVGGDTTSAFEILLKIIFC